MVTMRKGRDENNPAFYRDTYSCCALYSLGCIYCEELEMKGKHYLIIFTVWLSLLACGMSAQLPTLTSTPRPNRVNAESPAPKPTATARQMTVCNADNVNARGDKYQVISRLKRGDVIFIFGEKFERGGELWIPTSAGLVDPQYLCDEVK